MGVILGLNCYKHDAAASLLVDGRLMAAVEEERFRRQKHYGDYPERAVEYALESCGLDPADVDHVAYYMRPRLVVAANLAHSRRYLFSKGGLLFLLGQLNAARKMAAIPRRMGEHLGEGILSADFHFVDHHRAHAEAGFYCSGYDSAAVLSMDGVGERDTSLLASMDREGFREVVRSRFPHSPGIYYSTLTKHLGFRPDNDEYKVMGLSSYGQPEFADLFRRMIHHDGRGGIKVDTGLVDLARGVQHAFFDSSVTDVIGPPRAQDQPIEDRHQNVASSGQLALEELALEIARFLKERTRQRNLVVTGGVGLNCVMNGMLEREAGYDEVYPLPASHDSGTSLGAAVYVHRKVFPEVPLVTPSHMYLGPEYTEGRISKLLETAKIPCSRPEDLAETMARLLDEGRIVALFQGRMEFGPRALGNRSILADPRRAEMKDVLNSLVKHREEFRPFAPSCLRERAAEYFEGCQSSPYMIKTYPVRPGKRKVIPAVTHVDGTARVQTVSRDSNPFYHELIERFASRSEVPVVLNTSFNVRREPIVNTPSEAVRCFFATGIDALAMPPFLVEKAGISGT
ncbi:carbamoyltransferase [Candidatus Fermentibacteria bacterium]|nr:carbamoyltransferase [Candidatus Fermentibacteria bacterium]